MKPHNIQVLLRITSCYGYSRFNISSKFSSEHVSCKLGSGINSKLFNRKMILRLASPRGIDIYASRTGLYYNIHEVRLRKPKVTWEQATGYNVSEEANVGSNIKIKKESTFQAPASENQDRSIMRNEEQFGKKFLNLVEPCIKAVAPSLDYIQIKTNNDDTLAIHERYSMKYVFPTTFISTLAVPFEKEVSLPTAHSSYISSVCDSGISVPTNHASHMLYSSTPGEVSTPPKSEPGDLGKPSDEKLEHLVNVLSEELPLLFAKTLDYTIYSPDVIFENRIRGTRTVGIVSYIQQLSFLRILGHLKYAYVKLDILKITKHPEEGTIKVRWTIMGVSALKSFSFLFTLKSYSIKAAKEKMDTWYDGLSTFHVNKNGIIYKHVADDKMIHEEPAVSKKQSLLARLAALTGLAIRTPAPASSGTAAFVFRTCTRKGVTVINSQNSFLIALMASDA